MTNEIKPGDRISFMRHNNETGALELAYGVCIRVGKTSMRVAQDGVPTSSRYKYNYLCDPRTARKVEG